MDLDQQIQQLIENAPDDGKTPALIKAIAPALKRISEGLWQTMYYVHKTIDQGWVVTSLIHQSEPSRTKKVIKAYSTVADAKTNLSDSNKLEISIVSIPVIHILFQMLAMKTVDSVVFFQPSDRSTQALEVTYQELITALKRSYREVKPTTQREWDIV